LYKSLIDTKIKNHSNMFRIVCDPSSGSIELCLTEIIRGGSQMFVVCVVGVWQRNFEPVVCVYGTTGWDSPTYRTHTHRRFKITLPNTDQAHDKHQWTTKNFSQVQLYIPWWRIAYDPKHVGV